MNFFMYNNECAEVTQPQRGTKLDPTPDWTHGTSQIQQKPAYIQLQPYIRRKTSKLFQPSINALYRINSY